MQKKYHIESVYNKIKGLLVEAVLSGATRAFRKHVRQYQKDFNDYNKNKSPEGLKKLKNKLSKVDRTAAAIPYKDKPYRESPEYEKVIKTRTERRFNSKLPPRRI